MASGSYRQRTIQNVDEADATLIIYFGRLRGGTEQTMLHCAKRHKPYKLLDAEEITSARAARLAADFIEECGVSVLNVAGPRASQAPRAHVYAFEALSELLLRHSPVNSDVESHRASRA